MKDFELKTAWGVRRKKGEQICSHKHNFYELVYYCNGFGTGCVEKESYTITANTFALIPPNVEHEEHHQADCDLFCVGFLTEERLEAQFLQDLQGTVYGIIKKIIREATGQPLSYKTLMPAHLAPP